MRPVLLLTLLLFFGTYAQLQAQCTDPPVIFSTAVNDVLCSGSDDGAIDFNEGGGQPPYTYDWADLHGNDNVRSRNNLIAGVYNLTITDVLSCTFDTSFVVNEPAVIVVDLIITDAFCSDATGSIEAMAMGGTGIFVYTWNNGATGPVIFNLSAGLYTVTVTDDNGCSSTAQGIVSEPPALDAVTTTTDANCGQCDGTAITTVSGGTPPYIFEYGVPNNDPSNLCPGSYDVTISDANGCTFFNQFTILSAGTTSEVDFVPTFRDASCGECNGLINIEAFCGTAPYTYSWSHDANLSDEFADDLCPGTYTVTIMDAQGDSTSGTFTITAIDPLEVTGQVTNASCIYQPNGSIDLSVMGGRQVYTYIWSNTATTEDVTGLAPGTHSVTVVDALGCTVVESFTVGLLSNLDIDSITSTSSCNNDGTATISMTGGTGTLNYEWSNGGSDSTITGLSGGTYYVVTVTDDFCTYTIEVEVEGNIEFDVNTTTTSCDSIGGTATVNIVSGSTDPMINWSNGGTGLVQTDLSVGGYSVTVSDGVTGCQSHKNFFIETDSSCYVTISGYVYDDKAFPDCQVDTASLSMRLVRVDLSNGQAIFTDNNGYYEFQVPPDNYTISIDTNLVANSYLALCTDPITVAAVMPGSTYENKNFYFNGKGNFDLSLKVSKGRPRPGRVRSMWICLMNNGSEPVSGTLTFQHDPRQEYRGANFPETSYDANTQTVIWNFTDLAPGPVKIYYLQMYTDISVALGDTLRMTFRADPIAGDLDPTNNIIVDCPVITVNSYDPNDKAVLPEGEGAIGRIDQNVDKVLNYRVRFQNTGTDTAYTVVVRDLLDESLDPLKVIPGPSSHDYTLEILDGNILEFTFENINLVDSFTNEPGSNGFVFFDVHLKDNLSPGTEIRNKADIFFDFNPPIGTNTVLNTIRGEDVETRQTITGCGEVEFNDQIFTEDIIVIDTIPLQLYDSIVITTIEVEDTFEINLRITYCEDDNPVSPGIYTESYTAQNGCDSIVVTEVIVIPIARLFIDTTLGTDGIYEGQTYTNDTTLVNTYTGQNGCDSIVTTNIFIATTSVQKLFLGGTVKVFPNPASESVNVVFEKQLKSPIQLSIYNVLGERLRTDIKSGQSFNLDMEDFPPGTYWLVIRQGEGLFTEKIILIE